MHNTKKGGTTWTPKSKEQLLIENANCASISLPKKFSAKKLISEAKKSEDCKSPEELLVYLGKSTCQEKFDFFGIDNMSDYLSSRDFKMLIGTKGKTHEITDAILFRISSLYTRHFNKAAAREQFIKYLKDILECQVSTLINDIDIISAVCSVFNINITIFEKLTEKSRPTVNIYSYSDHELVMQETEHHYKAMLYIAKTHNQYYCLIPHNSDDTLRDHLWSS